jgi:hypothetical protein
LLVWRGTRSELCDVKSEERLDDPEFQTQVRATGLACAEAGLGGAVPAEAHDPVNDRGTLFEPAPTSDDHAADPVVEEFR